MTTLLDVDVPGLDLVLDGGIRVLRRVEGAEESATLLIRGPAGSGKTILGTQLAASIARRLGSDVAYGCVELLPVELRAQHEALRGAAFKEQVVPLGEHAESAKPEHSFVHLYAGLLDLGEEGQAVERLGDAVEALRRAANERTGHPIRVIVLDSLSDGYGLGSHAPRILADGISKLAADKGLIVILLEETVDERPSAWNFAVDTVLELGWAQVSGRLQRQLRISKNRLGAMDPGPHRLNIIARTGLEILPRVEAYHSKSLYGLLTVPSIPSPRMQPWGVRRVDELMLMQLPPFRSCVTAVLGQDSNDVRRLAFGLGVGHIRAPLDAHLGGDVLFKIGQMGGFQHHSDPPEERPLLIELLFGLSFLNDGASFLAELRWSLELFHKAGKSPRRVVVGDLRDLRYHTNAQDIVLAVSVAAALLRGLQIPLVLFDTLETPDSSSAALALADVSLTWNGPGSRLRVVNLSSGQEESIMGGPDDLILAK